jgi:DDE superfamily endonuclease
VVAYMLFQFLISTKMEDLLRDQRRRRSRFLLLMVVMVLDLDDDSFRELLDEEGRQRRDRRIPRIALLTPGGSAFDKLYSSGNNQALITVTGFDHLAFRSLLELFSPWYLTHTPWTGSQDGTTFKRLAPKYGRTGRKRVITAVTCLALVLAWYRFRGAEFQLQGWFGFTGTHANIWLRFGRRGLLIVLKKHPMSRVQYPTDQKIEELKAACTEKHPLLTDVYCVVDGVKFYFQQCEDLDEQCMYYNGWKCDHFVGNLFVFSLDGLVIDCVVNAPGSIHDSALAELGGVYDRLNETYQRTGGKCCVDSAFSSATNPFIVKSSDNVLTANNAEELLLRDQATSLRQAAEWGMHAIQSSFPRLKDRIHYENNGERKIFLQLLPLLYNYRTNLVGLNQIANTYVPLWSMDARYFVTPEEE